MAVDGHVMADFRQHLHMSLALQSMKYTSNQQLKIQKLRSEHKLNMQIVYT